MRDIREIAETIDLLEKHNKDSKYTKVIDKLHSDMFMAFEAILVQHEALESLPDNELDSRINGNKVA